MLFLDGWGLVSDVTEPLMPLRYTPEMLSVPEFLHREERCRPSGGMGKQARNFPPRVELTCDFHVRVVRSGVKFNNAAKASGVFCRLELPECVSGQVLA